MSGINYNDTTPGQFLFGKPTTIFFNGVGFSAASGYIFGSNTEQLTFGLSNGVANTAELNLFPGLISTYNASYKVNDEDAGYIFAFGGDIRGKTGEIYCTGNYRIQGAQKLNTTEYTAGNNSLSIEDTFALKTSITGGGDTMTLPSAVNPDNEGVVITVKDASGLAATDNITIDSAAGSIDGGATKLINVNYGSFTFVSIGGGWYTIASY